MAKKKELTIEEKLQAALVSKEEQPYEIPDSWVWVRWKNISQISSSRRVLQSEWKKEGIPFYRAREIIKLSHYGEVDNELFISEEHYQILKANNKMPQRGDLMVTGVGTVGISYVVQEKDRFYYKDASVLCVSPKANIHCYFLDYLMKSTFMRNQLNFNCVGTTVNTLTISKYEEYKIPIPPFFEQQRIVKKLDFLFEKTKKAKKLLQEVKEEIEMRKISILDKAFRGELTKKWREKNKTGSVLDLLQEIQNEKMKKWEEECREAEKNGSKKPKKIKLSKIEEMIIPKEEEPYEIPDTWKWVKLEEIFEIERGGSPRPIGEFLSNEEDAINWIKIGDTIKENKYIYSTKEKIKKEGKCKSRYVKAGDLLLTNSMSFGQAYILKCDGCIHDGWLVLGKKCKKILEEFYYYFLTTSYVYRKFSETAKGSTVKNLNKELVKPLVVVLIPLEEQQEIVRVLEEVLEKEKKVKELIDLEEKIDLLEKSILDKAFRGKLGTQGKNDEPALELLRKIWE